ncbi:MAG: cytochrome c oxidase assembly protein, partial [Deltaproteobacteria bacterium]|nr:cytochrome c oxidase assembly protein [Deltaproteobacteria bacterium]
PALERLSPIQDQALGGGIMWVSGHMYVIPILVLVARRLIAEDDAVNAAGGEGDGGLALGADRSTR